MLRYFSVSAILFGLLLNVILFGNFYSRYGCRETIQLWTDQNGMVAAFISVPTGNEMRSASIKDDIERNSNVRVKIMAQWDVCGKATMRTH